MRKRQRIASLKQNSQAINNGGSEEGAAVFLYICFQLIIHNHYSEKSETKVKYNEIIKNQPSSTNIKMKEGNDMWPWVIGFAAVVVAGGVITSIVKKRKH
jgi:hypothetical protein